MRAPTFHYRLAAPIVAPVHPASSCTVCGETPNKPVRILTAILSHLPTKFLEGSPQLAVTCGVLTPYPHSSH